MRVKPDAGVRVEVGVGGENHFCRREVEPDAKTEGLGGIVIV